MRRTVMRAMDSLQTGYEFGILGFQQLDSGPQVLPLAAGWQPRHNVRSEPHGGHNVPEGAVESVQGSSSLSSAFQLAFQTPAEAIILISDGLPNPAYNKGLSAGGLVTEHRGIQLEREGNSRGHDRRLFQIPGHSRVHGIAGQGQFRPGSWRWRSSCEFMRD